MGTTVSVTFPLGRYHATRWDGGANTSDVEWPPSPWRFLRALVATWYARWPELPAPDLDRVLARLGTPSAYLTPPARPGTSRHYMPGVSHTTARSGNTAQVLDAFLAVDSDDPLLIHWDGTLDAADAAILTKLTELMPYLGRSESLCNATVSDEATPDDTWWRLGDVGSTVAQIQLLAPASPFERSVLEQTSVGVRRARRLLPVGTRYLVYGRASTPPSRRRAVPMRRRRLESIRFELSGQVPLRARSSVLAADALHRLVGKTLTTSALDPVETADTMGLRPDGTKRLGPHEHMHILALPGSVAPRLRANTAITTLLLWAPRGFDDRVAGVIVDGARYLGVRRELSTEFAARHLLAAGSGELPDIFPGLQGPSREWISALPYLPIRHRKRNQDDGAFLAGDISIECGFHNLPQPAVVEHIIDPGTAGEIAQFRRRRNSEPMNRRRRGVHLRLLFDTPVRGPIALGQLSHFGYGLFVPVRD